MIGKFSRQVKNSVREIFLEVDGYNTYEGLERSKCLVCYQVSGEPIIAGCNAVAVRSSRRSDIYLGRCGRARAKLFVDLRRVNVLFTRVKFS